MQQQTLRPLTDTLEPATNRGFFYQLGPRMASETTYGKKDQPKYLVVVAVWYIYYCSWEMKIQP